MSYWLFSVQLLAGFGPGIGGLVLEPGLVLLAGVGVAARVLEHPTLSVEQDGRRHLPVDEVTVVADQQHCAFVVGDHFLQQVEAPDRSLVGVEQQVAGVGEALGQRQAVALTPESESTGARAARSLGRKSRM